MSIEPDLDSAELKARTERLRLQWSGDEADNSIRAKRKIRERAREWSELAVATLVDACLTGDSTSSRVAAAKELLDRGYGRPKEDGPQSQIGPIGVVLSLDQTRTAALNLLQDPQARAALRATLREKPKLEEP